MALSKKPTTGMKDILPEEMQIRDYVISVIKDTYGKFGFTFYGKEKIPSSRMALISRKEPDIR